jgi:hypothetical protein
MGGEAGVGNRVGDEWVGDEPRNDQDGCVRAMSDTNTDTEGPLLPAFVDWRRLSERGHRSVGP